MTLIKKNNEVQKYAKKQENKNLKNTTFNITKKENDKKEKGFRALQIKYENRKRELEKKRLKIKKKKKITMIAISMITMLNLMMTLIRRNMKKW